VVREGREMIWRDLVVVQSMEKGRISKILKEKRRKLEETAMKWSGNSIPIWQSLGNLD
jgi:hypothetical protein